MRNCRRRKEGGMVRVRRLHPNIRRKKSNRHQEETKDVVHLAIVVYKYMFTMWHP